MCQTANQQNITSPLYQATNPYQNKQFSKQRKFCWNKQLGRIKNVESFEDDLLPIA